MRHPFTFSKMRPVAGAFRAVRSAAKGAAFGIRKPLEKGLIQTLIYAIFSVARSHDFAQLESKAFQLKRAQRVQPPKRVHKIVKRRRGSNAFGAQCRGSFGGALFGTAFSFSTDGLSSFVEAPHAGGLPGVYQLRFAEGGKWKLNAADALFIYPLYAGASLRLKQKSIRW